MKRIKDMSEAEIVALDDTQIADCIDLECAFKNIPMLPPHPGQKPELVKVSPDVTIYSVGGLSFTDPEATNKIMEIVADIGVVGTSGYDEECRATKICSGEYNYPSVKTVKVLSQEKYNTHEEELKTHKITVEAWGELKDVYNTARDDRGEVAEKVWVKVQEMRGNAERREVYRTEFEKYKTMTEGDDRLAMNFLIGARPNIKEDFPELITELSPDWEMANVMKDAAQTT